MIGRTGIVEQVRLWDGLQSYYRIDETTGTSIADAIGGKTGTLQSGTINNVGKNNTCWRGTASAGKAIVLGNAFNFERTDSFSFAFWLKIDTLGQTHYLYSKQNNAEPYSGIICYLNNTNKLVWQLYSDNSPQSYIQIMSSETFTSGVWYHIVNTYDGSSSSNGLKSYSNGVLLTPNAAGTLTSSIVSPSTIDFCIGSNHAGTAGTYGYIDEFAVWNRVLNPAEVLALYSQGNGKFCPISKYVWNGLVFYCRCEEASGTVTDVFGKKASTSITGLGYHATGKNNYGFQFVKANKSIILWNSAADLNFGTGDFSISTWWYLNGSNSWGGGISKRVDDTDGYNLTMAGYPAADHVQFDTIKSNTHRTVYTASPIGLNQWVHLVGTRSGNTTTIYVNGAYSASQNAAKVDVSTTTYLNFGRARSNYDDNNYMNANIDETGLWNRALTQAEITTLYNSGNGIFY